LGKICNILSGSRGILPSQAVCAEAQTLLAHIQLSPFGEQYMRVLIIKARIIRTWFYIGKTTKFDG